MFPATSLSPPLLWVTNVAPVVVARQPAHMVLQGRAGGNRKARGRRRSNGRLARPKGMRQLGLGEGEVMRMRPDAGGDHAAP